jgi:rhodanese-related sulfurtransferase
MDVPRIYQDDLRKRLEDEGTIVIDVRRDQAKAVTKVKGARLENPDRVDSWSGGYPRDKTLVLYCT